MNFATWTRPVDIQNGNDGIIRSLIHGKECLFKGKDEISEAFTLYAFHHVAWEDWDVIPWWGHTGLVGWYPESLSMRCLGLWGANHYCARNRSGVQVPRWYVAVIWWFTLYFLQKYAKIIWHLRAGVYVIWKRNGRIPGSPRRIL